MGSWLAAGCNVDTTGSNPIIAPHCDEEFGDSTCSFRFPTKPYCDRCRPASQSQGCSAQPPQTPACMTQSGGSTTFATSTTGSSDTDGPATSSTGVDTVATTSISDSLSGADGSSSTGVAGFVCAGANGSFDEECEAADDTQPYCVDGQCVGCSDAGGNAFCVEVEATTPSCDITLGRCVSCLEAPETFSCEGASPVCGAEGACLPCTAHAQCPGSACHLDPSDARQGQCFADDERIWVNNNEICPGAGTEESPNCSLEGAMLTVGEGDNVVIIVEGTGVPYENNPLLTVDATVAVIGEGGPRITGLPADNDPTFQIEAGTVYLSRIRINDNPSDFGLTCENATVWLQNSEIANNGTWGVHLTGPCDMRIEGTTIHGNGSGGMRQFGGTLQLYNSAIGLNGDGTGGPGLNLQLTEVDIVYSTIVANAGAGAVDNIGCYQTTGVVRNSAIVGTALNSVDLDCFTLSFARNAIDTVSFAGGEGFLVDTPYNANWFVSPTTGDFRLAAPPLTPFIDVALWQDGDPPLDADGTPRPQGDETGYAGVDEPG